MYFFEKYVIIKIKEHKILVLMSILSLKLDEVMYNKLMKYNEICESLTGLNHIYRHNLR